MGRSSAPRSDTGPSLSAVVSAIWPRVADHADADQQQPDIGRVRLVIEGVGDAERHHGERREPEDRGGGILRPTDPAKLDRDDRGREPGGEAGHRAPAARNDRCPAGRRSIPR